MARAAPPKNKQPNGQARDRGRPRKDATASGSNRLIIEAAIRAKPEPRRKTEARAPGKNQPQPHETAARLARLTVLKTESRRIAGEISGLAADAKAAGGPHYWNAIKRVHDLQKLDPAEAQSELETLVLIAAQSEIRIGWLGSQATMTDILEMDQNKPPAKNLQGTRDLAAARANADGFNSGKNGALPHDNPHNPGSEEFVSWHEGRDEGARSRELKNPSAAARVREATTADATLPGEAEGTF